MARLFEIIQFFDANGDPLASGLIYTYEAGTSTPKVAYTDQTAGTPHPNPIVLDSAGRAQIWLDGTAYKLVVNLMSAVQLTALAEGLLLAEKAGLNMEKVSQGLTSGAVASPLVKNHLKRMVNRDHDHVNFSTRWMHKDAVYALRMAAELGQTMPLSAVAPQVLQLALSQGWSEHNFSAVIEGLRP